MDKLLQLAMNSGDVEAMKLAYSYLSHPLNYVDDPVGFCRNVLNVQLWAKQREIAEALVKHRRVLVKSANAIGKSFTAACLALWHFMTRKGITLVTAPNSRQVQDILFKEIRTLYGNRPGLYPKLSRIELSHDHYLYGFTTTDANNYQGIHSDNVFIIFEECVGIEPEFWEAANSILLGGDCYFLAICNPTDPTSQAYQEELTGRWHVITVSAFEHPNIHLELNGHMPAISGAIRLEHLLSQLKEWTTPIQDGLRASDITFAGQHYRPGPVAEARLLGRYPSQGSYAIFSEADFLNSCQNTCRVGDVVHIGCDVARFGDDFTTIHVRSGNVSLYHEAYNGRDTTFTAKRLKALADEYARPGQAKVTPIKVDSTGVGGGVADQRDGYNFLDCNSARRAIRDNDYPNQRSELLFTLADLLRDGKVDFTRLTKEQQQDIRLEAMGITYKLDGRGRRVAEPKHETKKRLKRSPDNLDAVCLAYRGSDDLIQFTPPTISKRPSRVNF